MFLVLFSILLQWGSNVLVQSTRFNGGFALVFPGPCPSGLVIGDITDQNCCAANQTFVPEAAPICCPDDKDCFNEVIKAEQCADPSWQLCNSQGNFCCLKDWTCYEQDAVSGDGGTVGCSTPGATLNSLQTKLSPGAPFTYVSEWAPAYVVGDTPATGATPVASRGPLTAQIATSSPSSPSSASATATVSRGSVTAQTTTSPLASPSAIRPTTSSGLNIAERIGIGVGVSVGFLFLIVIALLGCVLYRSAGSLSTRKKGKNDQVPADSGDSLTQRPDLDEVRAGGSTTHVPGQDRPMREVHELEDTCPYPRELQGSLLLYGRELQGSAVPYRRELP